ncbi:AraC family transcriptional regulator [Flavivirga eckloniae]|uniref:HTH araC/xylS-type domain-containing protein n=1 Tax=Flavivirga eckloniae TaxID=1803846 RepID=A0A2K9PU96_9FLAO|nr:AraC family transcriptional regulator [Flavivirga eckloniae]AUP80632.1 hypothetical protein C1H87_18710 [Flavivirga eckloniae]
MENATRLDRYKRLLSMLDDKFKEEITVQDIENTAFYSYRNINRIFLSLHQETIGQYQKRLRLEKAAEYLKFSNQSIADIAYDVGYSEISSFSKAFKKHFRCSPSIFRNSYDYRQNLTKKIVLDEEFDEDYKPEYTVEELPDLKIMYLTYYGDYDNIKAIKDIWEQLVIYALKKKVLHDKTPFIGEILDDEEITDVLKCRYNAAVVLDDDKDVDEEGLFRTKIIKKQKYAKFIHKGSHESCDETYAKIYTYWLTEMPMELADKPTLEFYINDESNTPEEELLTEIYIPVE